MTKYRSLGFLLVIAASNLGDKHVLTVNSFQPTPRRPMNKNRLSPRTSKTSSTELDMGRIGKLIGKVIGYKSSRKEQQSNEPIEILPQITVGSSVPMDVNVEIITAIDDKNQIVESKTASIAEVLGLRTKSSEEEKEEEKEEDGEEGEKNKSKKSLLVGMPGVFTTTCAKEHLPGYIASESKLNDLGIDKIAVLTTKNIGVLSDAIVDEDCNIVPITDGEDAILVRQLGLVEDMESSGKEGGLRSKRFAMIVDTEDGNVVHVAVDDNIEDCTLTSADEMIEYLTRGGRDVTEEEQKQALGVGGVVLLATLLAGSMGGDDGGGSSSPTRPAPSPPQPISKPTVQKVVPAKAPSTTKQTQSQPVKMKDSQFRLLEEYGSSGSSRFR